MRSPLSSSVLVTLLASWGCGGPLEPQPPPAAPVVANAPVVDVPAAASTAPPAATSGPSVDDAVAALRLLWDLCEAAEKGDLAFVREHTVLPLWGHELSQRSDAPWLHGVHTADKPASLQQRAMCQHRPVPGAALQDFRTDETTARGFVTLDGRRYRLTFQRTPPKLTEQTMMVDDVPLPPRAPTSRPLAIHVEPRGDDGPLKRQLAAAAEAMLRAEPHCVEAQAKREPLGLSMAINVVTRDSAPPEVNIYASTMGPVEYLGCLQAQLVPALQRVAASEKRSRLHGLWAMIGIAAYDHELPEDAAILELGGPGTP